MGEEAVPLEVVEMEVPEEEVLMGEDLVVLEQLIKDLQEEMELENHLITEVEVEVLPQLVLIVIQVMGVLGVLDYQLILQEVP